MTRPELSVVMVAGAQRERAQRTAEAIAAQTAVDAIELIVVDVGPDAQGIGEIGSLRSTRVPLSESTPWGSIRAAGVRAASGPVVAFVEDHCPPDPGWAEALLDAHREPWAAVGYAFRSANPSRWSSRALLIAEYGFWADPAPAGRSQILPGNNISYKRDLLLALGDRLDPALEIDNNLHRHFAALGLESAVEPRALVRHIELDGITKAARANYEYSRLLAAGRASSEGWGLWRRAIYAIAAPLGSPAMRTVRLARSLPGRRRLWGEAVLALPALALIWVWSGVGQSIGSLFGAGDAAQRLMDWELSANRHGVK